MSLLLSGVQTVFCSMNELACMRMLTHLSCVMQVIEELPGQESPEIFGLHPNADLTFRTLQVQAAVQIIMDTQPKGAGGGGGLSREEIVDRICEDLLSKVRSLLLKPTRHEQSFESSMLAVRVAWAEVHCRLYPVCVEAAFYSCCAMQGTC